MKPTKISDNDVQSDSFIQLIEIMRDDPEINERVIDLLNSESYQRRIVLNNWLEQLRRTKAPENLRQALSCLLDDQVAEKVLKLINHHQKKTDT